MRFAPHILLLLGLAAIPGTGVAQSVEDVVGTLGLQGGGAAPVGAFGVGLDPGTSALSVIVSPLPEGLQAPAELVLPGLGESETSATDPNNAGTDRNGDDSTLVDDFFIFTEADAARYAFSCTGADQDGDGVCDSQDRCPNTPRGAAVISSGCHLGAGITLVLHGVRFAYDSAQLTRASAPELYHAIQVLKQRPDIRVEIAGHTDDRGSDSYNRQLSLARARAVFQVLVKNGIDAERLSVAGYGRDQPVAANTRPDGSVDIQGMAENRRVEFRIVSES